MTHKINDYTHNFCCSTHRNVIPTRQTIYDQLKIVALLYKYTQREGVQSKDS